MQPVFRGAISKPAERRVRTPRLVAVPGDARCDPAPSGTVLLLERGLDDSAREWLKRKLVGPGTMLNRSPDLPVLGFTGTGRMEAGQQRNGGSGYSANHAPRKGMNRSCIRRRDEKCLSPPYACIFQILGTLAKLGATSRVLGTRNAASSVHGMPRVHWRGESASDPRTRGAPKSQTRRALKGRNPILHRKSAGVSR